MLIKFVIASPAGAWRSRTVWFYWQSGLLRYARNDNSGLIQCFLFYV